MALTAWLGNATVHADLYFLPHPARIGQAVKKPSHGKEGQIQWWQWCLYPQSRETWSLAQARLPVIWQKQFLSPSAGDWLGKESIPWALVISAHHLFCTPLTHTCSFSLSLPPSVLCQEAAQNIPNTTTGALPFPSLSLISSVPGGTFSTLRDVR